MTPGPIGTFRATCTRLREDHKELAERRNAVERFRDEVEGLPDSAFCNEKFDNFPDAEAHMKAVHPKLYRAQRRSTPAISSARAKAYGTPAVKVENQAVPPGTRFTHKGRDCQVIGAASATRTRFLLWLPDDVDPGVKTARRHWELGKNEHGMWTWELTTPTKTVLKALADQEI